MEAAVTPVALMIQAKILPTVIPQFRRPYVAGLRHVSKSGLLVIDYCSNGDKEPDYAIVFDQPRGFRLLDEGDLLNYWEALWQTGMILENALFEIERGGWLDLEDTAGGFTSKLLGCREFLIAGGDDCVSVISFAEPEIRPL